MEEKGVDRACLTLRVGPGTFRPIRCENVEDHKMEEEHFSIPPDAALKIDEALEKGKRIVAVGTTTVRALEAAIGEDGRIKRFEGETDLFIYPGYRFHSSGALLTNFHLPRSTLFMLVCAFAGRDLIFEAYRRAVEERYRFYSFGDAMLII
jgi:S-adenosylmethionine:tRNA ribosyltransferase-isomerase